LFSWIGTFSLPIASGGISDCGRCPSWKGRPVRTGRAIAKAIARPSKGMMLLLQGRKDLFLILEDFLEGALVFLDICLIVKDRLLVLEDRWLMALNRFLVIKDGGLVAEDGFLVRYYFVV
jgi:hypothetical protein